MKKNLVSIIIPIFNEQRNISDCIASLQSQSYKPLEIIVVDDGSTDKTRKILKKTKGIKLLYQEHEGPGAARNKGALKSKGEILVFVDADMTFNKRFIDKLTKPIIGGKVIGTFTKEEFVSNNENSLSQFWSINRGFQAGRMHPINYPDKQKVFRAISKDQFEKVSGFDTKIGYTDDWTLSHKLGTKAISAPGAMIYHRNPDSIKEAFGQAFWMAKRPYKLGFIGKMIALFRVSLPISLIVGLTKSVKSRKPLFVFYKIIVDFASFLGIIHMSLTRQYAK